MFFFANGQHECNLRRNALKGPQGPPEECPRPPRFGRGPKITLVFAVLQKHTEQSTHCFCYLVCLVSLQKLGPPADPQRAPQTPQVAPERSRSRPTRALSLQEAPTSPPKASQEAPERSPDLPTRAQSPSQSPQTIWKRHVPTQLWDTRFSQDVFPPNFGTDNFRETCFDPTLGRTILKRHVPTQLWDTLPLQNELIETPEPQPSAATKGPGPADCT